MGGLVPYKRDEREPLSLSVMSDCGENMAICKPGGRASPATESAASRTLRNEFL